MSLGKQDVLNTLRDTRVANIDFWLQGLHIHSDAYSQVASAIEADRIHIRPGYDWNRAFYWYVAGTLSRPDGTTESIPANTLITQNVSVLTDAHRALLLHECTHAYVDLSVASATTALSGEVAAYIAQTVFLMSTHIGFKPRRNGKRLGRMFHGVGDLVVKFRLHRPEGRGARLQLSDYSYLRGLIHHVRQYHDVGMSELTPADGI